MAEQELQRVALVVHPKRPIDGALETLQRWTEENGLELVQLAGVDVHREVAEPGTVNASDLVIALGGDGTVLTALRAAAMTSTPVLGVACGSLGVLSAVPAGEIAGALERFRTGDWTPRSLPALAVHSGAGQDWALNDFVLFRRGSAQLACSVTVDDEPYVRMAGDGLIVATALGSTAYSMAAGGPVLAGGTAAFVCTPLAMHGGSAPPLVIPAAATLTVDVYPSFSGFDVEIDGHRRPVDDLRFQVTLHPGKTTLVGFAEPAGRGLAALRRRRLISDSPRILARDDRTATPTPAPSEH
jgi:NAD+ kinase